MPGQLFMLVLLILGLAMSLGCLVCYILVVIQMFQHGKTGPGLFGTIGLLLCGIGYLFTFIYGWTKASEWRLKNVMIAWTALFVLQFGFQLAGMVPAMQAAREAAVKQVEAERAKAAPVPEPAAP